MNSEKPTPPALGEFALEERDQLLARVAEQAGQIGSLMETFVKVADFLGIDTEAARKAPGKPSDVFIAAIKAQQPTGVVLPTVRLWPIYPREYSRGFVDALEEVARLNSSPVSAGDDAFCDDHCTWLDHHPSCARAAGATSKQSLTVGGVDERPIATCQRGLFETWAMETEHPVFGYIGSDWLDHGDDPNTYANDYIQGAWVMFQNRTAGRAAQLVIPPMIEFDELVSRLFELDADARKYCARHWLLTMWKATLDRVCELNAGRAAVPDRALLSDVVTHLTDWLNLHECECENGHICGRGHVRATRDRVSAMLAAPSAQQQGGE